MPDAGDLLVDGSDPGLDDAHQSGAVGRSGPFHLHVDAEAGRDAGVPDDLPHPIDRCL
jgi:hypothetical protein